MKLKIGMAAWLATALLASGCATTYVNRTVDRNPPPAEALGNFDRFEILPIQMDAPYAGQDANEAAKAKIQENLDERLTAKLAAWNARPAAHDPARVLRIEPRIRDIKFISGAARAFGGAFAGSSAVVMDVRMVDAATGAEVASPEFFSRGNGWAGAYSFGVSDNIMLIRPGTLLAEYMQGNFAQPVGGRNSAE